jgi:hypothetical protein
MVSIEIMGPEEDMSQGSVERDRLELGYEFPDTCPRMNGHIGVVTDLVNFRYRFSRTEADTLIGVHQKNAGLICDTPYIPRYCVVLHDVLQHLDTVLDSFFRISHTICLTDPPLLLLIFRLI